MYVKYEVIFPSKEVVDCVLGTMSSGTRRNHVRINSVGSCFLIAHRLQQLFGLNIGDSGVGQVKCSVRGCVT